MKIEIVKMEDGTIALSVDGDLCVLVNPGEIDTVAALVRGLLGGHIKFGAEPFDLRAGEGSNPK